VRLEQEAHPRAGGGEQRVVLRDVFVAHPVRVGDEDGEDAAAADDDRAERTEPVARDRAADLEYRVHAPVVDDAREDAGRHEAGEREERAEAAPPRPRREDCDHEADGARAE
jgi:hypothetical protein